MRIRSTRVMQWTFISFVRSVSFRWLYCNISSFYFYFDACSDDRQTVTGNGNVERVRSTEIKFYQSTSYLTVTDGRVLTNCHEHYIILMLVALLLLLFLACHSFFLITYLLDCKNIAYQSIRHKSWWHPFIILLPILSLPI
jgi:hypothetical protein